MTPISNPEFGILATASALLWDFDGVLMDSMPVRNAAFRHALRAYPKEQVEQLVAWHERNGGWSRYVKFHHFQTHILGQTYNEKLTQSWALDFSDYCRLRLVDSALLIPETNRILSHLAKRVPMHIVSGSDGNELRDLCEKLDLSMYFISIEGSPTPKNELVSHILAHHSYHKASAWLIGDSQNDFEAANANGLKFMGFMNPELAKISDFFWRPNPANCQ